MASFTPRTPSPNQSRSGTLNRSITKHSSSQKENERDSSLSRAAMKGRSPSINSSSSSHKGFMAPTISASSKGRSPRSRTVLSDRNQNPTQTEEFLSKSDSKTTPVVAPLPIPSPVTKSTQLDPEPSASLPPYDPKTNYLSPRPQYLHYRPNPRIEMIKKGELDLFETFDGKNLDECFSSESSGTESSVKTEEEERSSPSELIEINETEGISSEIDLHETEEKERSSPPELIEINKTEEISTEIDLHETKSTPLAPNSHSKTRFKLKIAPLALIFLLIVSVFIPLSDSPVLTPSNSNLRYPLQFDAIENRIMEISNRLSHWSTQSIQYFSYLFASEAPFPIQIGTFPLGNTSSQALYNGDNLDYDLAVPISNGESVFNEMEVEIEEEEENEKMVDFETVVNNEDVKEMQDRFEIGIIENEDEEEAREIETGGIEFGSEPVKVEENPEDSSIGNKMDNGFGSESTETMNGVDPEIESEPVNVENQKVNEVESRFESEPAKLENREDGALETASELDNGFSSEPVKVQKKSNLFAIGIIASIAISSLASLVMISAYVKKNRVSVSVPANENATPVKEKSGISDSGSGSSESFYASQLENSSVDMDMEVTTSLNGTDFSTGTGRANGSVKFTERLARRESDVSTGSFGSFTTYEKVASKKVTGEEMTPVRRSSRIRSRVVISS